MKSKKKFFLVLAMLLNITIACNTFFPGRQNLSTRTFKKSVQLSVTAAPESKSNLQMNPGRIYVTRQYDSQKAPQLILKAKGLRPGTTVFWSYKYSSGPHKIKYSPTPSFFFSSQTNHPLNRWNNSTIANSAGECEVLFTGTTYAGDSFQFGISLKEYIASFKHENNMSIRFRNSIKKTKLFVVWKQIFLERPKILRGVIFSRNTWKWVKEKMELLNVECNGLSNPLELDSAHPAIYYYFFKNKESLLRGKEKNARYGPEGYGPMEVMLSRLNTIFSDNNRKTINVFIFGATSKKRDLVRNLNPSSGAIPQPVDYQYFYKKDEVDLQEWIAFGTGRSMAGNSPAIFIWSDFWWLASKIINVSHEKTMARVILHELGHQLLMFKREGEAGILDATGHIDQSLITRKCIMTGSGITRLNQKGKPYISSASIRLERRFINNPSWHPKIEMLIRRDYIPQ